MPRSQPCKVNVVYNTLTLLVLYVYKENQFKRNNETFFQNKLISQYEIPKDQYCSISSFSTLAVDVRDYCDEDPFVYIGDGRGGIIVYDVTNKCSWMVEDKTFYPSPDYSSYSINGKFISNTFPCLINNLTFFNCSKDYLIPFFDFKFFIRKI